MSNAIEHTMALPRRNVEGKSLEVSDHSRAFVRMGVRVSRASNQKDVPEIVRRTFDRVRVG